MNRALLTRAKGANIVHGVSREYRLPAGQISFSPSGENIVASAASVFAFPMGEGGFGGVADEDE